MNVKPAVETKRNPRHPRNPWSNLKFEISNSEFLWLLVGQSAVGAAVLRFLRCSWEAYPLVLVIFVGLAVALPNGFHSVFQSDTLVSEAGPLDSFSAPSLALSALNREALRLIMAYTQHRDKKPATSASLPRHSVSFGGPTAVSGVIEPIAKLDAQVQRLKSELDCRLLWIYAENGREQQFLDRYLALLAEAPGTPDVNMWMPQAINFAQRCGRTDELVDALTHFARFNGTAQRAQSVRDLLSAKGFAPCK
jgi:hypothetical protein